MQKLDKLPKTSGSKMPATVEKQFEPSHHLLIGGTGRSGTTLLVQVLAACGLSTIIGTSAEYLDDDANAGLESDLNIGANSSYVVKSPALNVVIDALLSDEKIKIDGVIIPVRSLEEAAASRIILEIGSDIRKSVEQDVKYKNSSAIRGTSGAIFSIEPIDQARILAMEFHGLVEALLEANIPIHFLKFPKFVKDKEYLYDKLKPCLPKNLTLDDFIQKTKGVIKEKKVRVSNELSKAAKDIKITKDSSNFKSLMEIENIALRREIEKLRTESEIIAKLKAEKERADFYEKGFNEMQAGYNDLANALTETQKALTDTQLALQQTQAALNVKNLPKLTKTSFRDLIVAAQKEDEKAHTKYIEIDNITELEEKTIGDLIATNEPAQNLYVPEMHFEVIQHSLSRLPSNAEEAKTYQTHIVRAPEMVVERLQNQYWFPDIGFLVSKSGKVWKHSVLGQFADPHFLTTHAVQDLVNENGETEYIFHENLLNNAPKLEGLHLITSHYASHNYGHYLMDMVPLLQFGKDMNLNLLTRKLLPWQERIYNNYSFKKNQITQTSERVYFLEEVIVSNRHNAVSTYAASPNHRNVFERLLKAINKKSPNKNELPKRIFLSRGESKNRNLRNRPALEAMLKQHGFISIRPETFTFEEQAQIFANAELIVSEFGAVMANVAFCKPGTKVIEIIPEGQNDPWSSHLGAAMGLEHVVLFHKVKDEDREPIEIGGRSLNNIYFNYDADVALIEKVAIELISD